MTEPERPDCPSGVYTITCTTNGKVYVGSSNMIERRWNDHRRRLREDCHRNRHLQGAWNKYGGAVFEFRVVEFVPLDRLIEREQHWIDALDASSRSEGFNLRTKAESNRGCKHPPRTPETRARISAANKKRRASAETRAKMSSARKGKIKSPEHRAKLSSAQQERALDPEYRAMRSEVARKRSLDPEYRAKLSAATRRHYANLRAATNPVRFIQLRWWS